METVIKKIVDRIYNQKTYPTLSFSSKQQVEDIVRYYMTVNNLYSKASMSNRYFVDAPTERKKFLGDEWVRAIYEKVAGKIPVEEPKGSGKYSPPRNYNLRDRIWFTLNLIRDAAKADAYYMPVWQYFKYKDAPKQAAAIVKKAETPVVKPVVVSPKPTGQSDPQFRPSTPVETAKKYGPFALLALGIAKIMKVI